MDCNLPIPVSSLRVEPEIGTPHFGGVEQFDIKAAAEIGMAFWSDDTDKPDRTAMVSDDQTEQVFREGTRLRAQLGR